MMNEIAVPQTEGMITNQINGASMQNQPAKTNGRNKRKPIPVLWQVLGKAKRVFDVQIDKTNDVKLRCVERFMGTDAHDVEKFWLNFQDQVDLILDSKRFERQCDQLALNPEIVAEHIVFLGHATVKRVMAYGIEHLGNEVSLYKERFTADRLKSKLQPKPEQNAPDSHSAA